MSQLKLQSQEVKLVEYKDLERFIADAYGLKTYEYPAIEEIDNDSYQMYSVKKEELSKYEKDSVERLKEKGYQPYVTMNCLTDLCNKGWIEEGDYLIHVSW